MNNQTTIADTDALYVSAAAAELASDFDRAFGLYLSAAQAYLHHVRTLPASRVRELERCKADAKKCLERAERIKAARRSALIPLVRDPFSVEEQIYVLDKSAKVHGSRLPVWIHDSENIVQDEVDVQPPLDPAHLVNSPIWRRPSDFCPSDAITLASPSLQPHHIRQNVVTDCSVCSAAAICLHHHRTFGSKLGLSCIFPHDTSGMPVLAPDGRYALRLFVNGAFRAVSIDDLLPFYADGRPISASTTPDFEGFDLWPGLLEKAYMKLMGGYDFPGSNSSVDVHALTGWIPEHIEIKSPSFVREKAWRRTYRGFKQGSCILTLGTGTRGGSLLKSSGESMQLLPTHSYAVLDVCEDADGSERTVTTLDPWTASLESNVDTVISGVIGDLRALQVRDHVDEQVNSGNEDACLGGRLERGASVVHVAWNDVCTVFDGIYLNWDPALFKYQIQFHGSWRQKADANSDTSQCVRHHLTLSLSPSNDHELKTTDGQEGNELWVLLTRHIVDKRRKNEFIALHAVQLEHGEAGGEVEIDEGLNLKGTYTNSTHTLTRLVLTDPSAPVAIVSSYDGSYADVGFTVQAFSSCASLAWISQPRRAAYERIIEGTFSSRSAGGNSTYPTFMNNPQYRLHIYPEQVATNSKRGAAFHKIGKTMKSSVRLIVEGPRNVPLNAVLVWRNEKECSDRVIQLGSGDVVSNSGAYSYGVAQAAASVAPGDYCIIVSAFEPRHRGSFTLRIESTARMDVDAIPAEGAGMFCKTVKSAWTPGLDGGSPRFKNYDKNPTFEIDVRTATPLKIRLQLMKPSPSIALNVTLFASASPDSPPSPSLSSHRGTESYSLRYALGRQIATSGAYADGSSSPAGVVTPQMTVAPGRYLAVASTFDPAIHTDFQLLVFAKADVKVASIR